jgi:hypothetical protein
MMRSVLLITAVASAPECAQVIEKQLGLKVEIVADRRTGMAALRRQEYAVVILDENLALADPAAADVLWKQAGLGIPIEVNFAICGCARIAREVRASLARRDQEQMLAMRSAAALVESELNSAVTGLVLQSELAMNEPGVTPAITARLQTMRALAQNLRERLRQPAMAPQTAKTAIAKA